MLKIDRKYTLIISLVLGIFFVLSGTGKMIDSRSFSVLINDYGLGYFSAFAPFLIIAEIVLGVNLILRFEIKKTCCILIFLVISFTIAFGYAYLFKGITDCGCFGKINSASTPPLFTFLRNIIILALLSILLINHQSVIIDKQRWQLITISLIIAISAFITGNTYDRVRLAAPFSDILVKDNSINPKKFLGKNINDTPIRLLHVNKESQLIFILSPSCPHCINSIENIGKIIEKRIAERTDVYLNSRLNTDTLPYSDIDFPVNIGNHDILKEISGIYPTTIYIKNDTVSRVLLGTVPSYINLIESLTTN